MARSILQKTAAIDTARGAITQLYQSAAAARAAFDLLTDMGLLAAGALTDADFINENAGISAADFVAGVTAANHAVNNSDRAALAAVRI